MKRNLLNFEINFSKWIAMIIALLFISQFGNAQTIKGKIIDGSNSESVIDATVIIKGTTNGTVSSKDGTFELTGIVGNSSLEIRFIGYKTQIIDVVLTKGQTLDLGTISLSADELGLNEVVVTGSRRDARTVIKSVVPIDMISSKDVQISGSPQTVEILQNLVPSYTAMKNSITDATDYVRPAQLRGLGPEHVLVLVNGKRRHISAVVHDNEQARGSVNVDMNSIPSSAIDHIEVLRDGAAAQYGSDAVAGVINIVLKKSTDLNVNFSSGMYLSHEDRGYKAGEGLRTLANGSLETDASLSAGNYYNGTRGTPNWTNHTYEKNHTDGKNYIASISKGFNIGDKGSVFVAFQYWKQGKSDRAGLDPEYQYFGTTSTGARTFTNATLDLATTTLDPKEATIDREMWWFGKSEMTDISGFFNASYQINSNIELYAFGGISNREGNGPCFWRQSGSANNVRSIFPDGYMPAVQPKIMDVSVAAGLKGSFGKINYDLSETYGYNDFNFAGTTLNVSLGGYNDISDPTLKARTYFDGGGNKFFQYSTNLDLSTELEMGLASPLNIAFGGEYRNEKYEIYKGEPASYTDGKIMINDGPYVNKVPVVGTQCVSCFNNVDAVKATRSNVAAYLDAEVDVAKSLTIGAAGRFENYSDFGSTLTGKFSTRYEIIKSLAVRGSVSSGFRAPALGQQYYSNTSLQTATNGSLLQTGTFPVSSEIAKKLGAKSLNAEKSVNISAGVTFNIDNLSIAADLYQIDIKDRIILSELFSNPSGKTTFSDYVNTLVPGSGIQQVNYFTNGLNTRTQGIDLVIRYMLEFNKSSNLRFTFAGNFTKTKITNNAEIGTPEKLKPYTSVPLLGPGNQVRMENSAPQSVLNFILKYKYKDFSIQIKPIYYGKIKVAERFLTDDPTSYQTYEGKVLTDLELGYDIMKDLSISLGSNNLLDVYPEKRYKATSHKGRLPYSGYVPYGFMGRYTYLRIAYTLK